MSPTDYGSFEWPAGGGGSGTLTSVGLADGSLTPIYSISGSPVTTAGTLTFTLSTQTANKIFAGPTTGSAAQPTFRSLVTADLPFAITNLTDVGTDGITIGNGTGAVIGASPVTITQHVADTTHSGYLSSTDWNTFNGKQAAGSYITALTGDVTAAGPGSVGATLAATSNGTLVTLSALTTASSLASIGTITTGTWNATTIAVAHGGTGQVTAAAAFNALSPITTTGDIIYSPAGATSQRLAVGSTGDVLTVSGGVPAWAPPATSGTVTSVAQTVPAFLSISGSPITGAGTLAISLSGTALPIANGGTGVTSVTTAPAASAFAGWDTNKNLSANSFLEALATTATAGTTTTLSVSSKQFQQFTGTTTQTVVLPDATTLAVGQAFVITNRSTGIVTVNANGGGLIQTMLGGSQAIITAVTVGTTAGTWDSQYTVGGVTAPVNPTIQTLVSGTAQTYTRPAGVQYIRVRMVGGGGGGGGATNGGSPTAGGPGGDTIFGTSLLVAKGGSGGGSNATGTGGAGGVVGTLNSPAIGSNLPGGAGQPSQNIVQSSGGAGGSSLFGGSGSAAFSSGSGLSAGGTNTGGGGGGAGGASVFGGGGGGGAGGLIDVLIPSPSSTYTYTIGAAGTAGTGTDGGAAGGSGYIEVTEYYSNFSVGTTAVVTANNILAGPSSGAAAVPTFRTLVPTDFPSVYVFYTGNGGTALTANTTNIDWTTKVQDSNNAWNGTTFTAPFTGFYLFSGGVFTTAGVTATIGFYIGGSIKNTFGAGVSSRVFNFSAGYFMNSGDALTLRSDTNATLSNSASIHWISIASQW